MQKSLAWPQLAKPGVITTTGSGDTKRRSRNLSVTCEQQRIFKSFMAGRDSAEKRTDKKQKGGRKNVVKINYEKEEEKQD